MVIFLLCECGERVTGHYNAIDRVICECDWYSFPHDVQKMLPIVMMSTQRPVSLKGFGNIFFIRETFKMVFFGILQHSITNVHPLLYH